MRFWKILEVVTRLLDGYEQQKRGRRGDGSGGQ